MSNQNAWNNFATRYNQLARKMKRTRIPLALLRGVVEAAQEVERFWRGTPSTDFRVVWDNYSSRYNALAQKMEEAGLSPKLLRDVVDAAQGVRRVS